MPNKKKDKQFFSLAGIDWSDDASIDAGAAAMWAIINARLSSEMKPTIELTGSRILKAVAYANWEMRNAHHSTSRHRATDGECTTSNEGARH